MRHKKTASFESQLWQKVSKWAFLLFTHIYSLLFTVQFYAFAGFGKFTLFCFISLCFTLFYSELQIYGICFKRSWASWKPYFSLVTPAVDHASLMLPWFALTETLKPTTVSFHHLHQLCFKSIIHNKMYSIGGTWFMWLYTYDLTMCILAFCVVWPLI